MIPGVLLAAGRSERFGSQKLLVSYKDGKTLIERALWAYLNASVSPLVVVVSNELLSALGSPLKYVSVEKREGEIYVETPWGMAKLAVNPTPEAGMAGSLKLGLSSLTESEREDGVLVSLADLPEITPETIQRLVALYRQGEGKIVAPTFNGQTGHPVILHEPFFRRRIAQIRGDRGLRDILKENREDVTLIPWDDASVITDVDTQTDLEKILERGDTP